MAAPTLEEMNKAFDHWTHSSKQMDQSFHGVLDQATNFLRTILPLEIAWKAINLISGQAGNRYAVALKTLTMTTDQLILQRQVELERLAVLKKKADTDETVRGEESRLRSTLAATEPLYLAQVKATGQIEKMGRLHLLTLAGIVSQITLLVRKSQEYNEALKKANSDLFVRYGLMGKMLTVQAATGASTAVMVQAARALVNYSMTNKSTWEANLKTVVMLHEALGLSVEEAAQLGTVAETYAKVSFQDVADAVATVVDQTSLAAGEVKNLGMELMRAVGVLKPGGASDLPQVIKAMGAYEGALKEVSGRVGGFQKLVTQLSTPEGLLASGVLGVRPEMMATQSGIEQIMERFDAFVKAQVGNSEGMARMWRLENVARSLNIGLTREEISEMERAIEVRRQQGMQDISLEKRFSQEIQNLDQGFSRLFQSFQTLVQGGLYPVVWALSRAVNWLAIFAESIAKWKYIWWVMVPLATTGAVALAGVLIYVAKKFWEVATAAAGAARSLNRYVNEQLMADMASKGGGGGGSTLPTTGGVAGLWPTIRNVFNSTLPIWRSILTVIRSLAIVLTPMGALVTIVSGIAVGLSWWGYRMWKDTEAIKQHMVESNRRISVGREAIERKYGADIYGQFLHGHPEEGARLAGVLLNTVAGKMREEHKDWTAAQREEYLRGRSEEIIKEMGTAMYKRSLFSEGLVTRRELPAVNQEEAAANIALIRKATENALRHDERQAQVEKERYYDYKYNIIDNWLEGWKFVPFRLPEPPGLWKPTEPGYYPQ